MKYTNINNTDLKISTISYGTANMGINQSQIEANRLLDNFLGLGGSYIDTAEVYSDWIPGEKCRSEKFIGRWLKEKGGRDKFYIGTKGAHPRLNSMDVSRMSLKDLTFDIENSLMHLNTDYIDIYWLHRDDKSQSVLTILQMMEGFVRSGKIQYYGCSNWSTSRMQEAYLIAKENGFKGFIANQAGWNCALVNSKADSDPTLKSMDKKMLDFHKESKTAVFTYSSQAGGLYNIIREMGFNNINEGLKAKYYNETNRKIYEIIIKYIGDSSMTPTQFSLGYLLSQSGEFNTVALIGTNNLNRQNEAIKASDIVLPAEIVDNINSMIL